MGKSNFLIPVKLRGGTSPWTSQRTWGEQETRQLSALRPGFRQGFSSGGCIVPPSVRLRISQKTLPALSFPYFFGTSLPMVWLLVSVVPGHSSRVKSCSDWGAALRRWRRLHSSAWARAAWVPHSRFLPFLRVSPARTGSPGLPSPNPARLSRGLSSHHLRGFGDRRWVVGSRIYVPPARD